MPIALTKILKEHKMIKMESPYQVFQEEFRNYYSASSNGKAVGKINVYDEWDWIKDGQHKTVEEAIAITSVKGSFSPFNEQYKYLIKQTEIRNKSIQMQVSEGKEIRFNTYEDTLKYERTEILKKFLSYQELWPKNSLLLRKHIILKKRMGFLKQFDFNNCPAINLFIGLWAYKRYRILNEGLDSSISSDFLHAALGCQYANIFLTLDQRFYRALKYVASQIPVSAKIYSSVKMALLENS